MPTYAYRCADCGYAFDIHQQFTDESLTVCPQCQGTLRKHYGSVGVTFKGSGFYRTDSRASSSTSASSTTASTATAASKPASKPSAKASAASS